MEELVVEEIQELLEKENDKALKQYLDQLNISDVEELIDELPQYAAKFIETLSLNRAVNVFRILDFPTQERIIKKLSGNKLNQIIKDLPPDDRTALFSELKGDVVKKMITLLPPEERKESLALLGYKEDSIGRLMTPDYIAVKPEWSITRVLAHIRRYGKNSETIDVVYVIDKEGVLLDDIRIREVLLADPEAIIGELTDKRFIALKANDPQEDAINIFRMNNRVALPVVDENNILLGIVTVDDILWIANEEYTEDMHKIGGTEALDEPYLDIPILKLVKKRAGWLIVLFLGEMLTATAMQHFEIELEKAVVLSLFIPLIMSSGGNSGSQASTLIIQAMALGEVTIAEWWRVMRRELVSGALLGIILGTIGFIRIVTWQELHLYNYGPHWFLIAATIFFTLVGIVLWGSLIGSMMPIILKKLKLDPATSSAPFVATMVDVTGIVIYFSVAVLILKGVLL
ncbi:MULTISPECIES: magnesium transporter [Pedobacter]|jgi:magnesium transporter|uniref:magnesium transporter n=1 Tax=Pedobacter TaxID=84567 RepID=UPI00049368A3|nr:MULTISPECIES: magnesium transporter [Pedobacter]MDQ0964924.1 magnesium transporter [Flavobacterium sp. W4I14]MBT2560474.1 magnesium transporter [Pedobacter sp. ISL-64]MBT2593611.1 magnesium transporter [Pedobacter sp. ISL-68]MDQ0638486.1 magnesium transporter [Pedobacter sp. W3I1]CAH0267863.1 Magnesium transporter MgtE [Pedobacter sp. Bi36]